jgi:hypothetical protein
MTHEHHLNPVVEVEAPVGEAPGHTKFYLLACACGHCTVFPLDNFFLADEDWRLAFAARLRGEGYRFERGGSLE